MRSATCMIHHCGSIMSVYLKNEQFTKKKKILLSPPLNFVKISSIDSTTSSIAPLIKNSF